MTLLCKASPPEWNAIVAEKIICKSGPLIPTVITPYKLQTVREQQKFQKALSEKTLGHEHTLFQMILK